MLSSWTLQAVVVFGELLLTLGQVQVSLLLLAPLWLMLYLAVRALCTTRQSRGPLAWLRGFLAWGIVATHAQVSARYAPVARWRLFWALNGIAVAALGFALRPDLGMPLALFVTLWMLAQGVLFLARHQQRAERSLPR